MAYTKQELAGLYGGRAKRYDITANLFRLSGFRMQAARRKAVDALALRPGDTVVEIGCGTGLNFPLLRRAVGPAGKIIGVDLTPGMLDVARHRAAARGWSNIELVNCDAAEYRFPPDVDGVISTFAITLVPEYDQVIRNAAGALAPGKRLTIVDLRAPQGLPTWLMKVIAALAKPFGVTLDLRGRHPWESVERHLAVTSMESLYFGIGYIVAGEPSPPRVRSADRITASREESGG